MFWILAFDHRNSFRTRFLGLTGAASAADTETARRLKTVIARGLLRAVEEGIDGGLPAALVDDEYGAEAIGVLRDRGVAIAVPVEVSGRRELAFIEGDEGVGRSVEAVGARWAKVLVRYNADGDPGINARQRQRLLALQSWAAQVGTDVMIELLVPPESFHLTRGGEFYDDELRPALTARAVGELTDAGLVPHLWKLEGMPSTAAYAAIAAACGAGTPGGPRCVVLGRGADAAAVDDWLTGAAAVPGFAGFAVGRTLWWDALRAHLDGTIGTEEAAVAIGAAFRRLVDVYLLAAK